MNTINSTKGTYVSPETETIGFVPLDSIAQTIISNPGGTVPPIEEE